jgi:hypothetical protein
MKCNLLSRARLKAREAQKLSASGSLLRLLSTSSCFTSRPTLPHLKSLSITNERLSLEKRLLNTVPTVGTCHFQWYIRPNQLAALWMYALRIAVFNHYMYNLRSLLSLSELNPSNQQIDRSHSRLDQPFRQRDNASIVERVSGCHQR